MPLLVLAAAAIASFAWILSLDSQLTFIADDWELLVAREGTGASYFLDSLNGNLIIGLGVAYRLLRAVFGLDSATPFYVVSIGFFVLSAILLFVYLRRRVDDWLAVLAAILVLFLGAAFEDLLFAFQLGYFASVAAGLGMLLALDREDETGDRLACLLLVVSIVFSSIGIAFAAGALADLLFGKRLRARRAYVVAIPVLLYALWWLGWGHNGENSASLHNLLRTPKFAFDSAAAGVTSLLGLATGDGSEPDQPHLIWGKLVVLLGLAGLAFRIYRERRISRGMAVALAIGLALWFITGLNRESERFPTSSRYQYPYGIVLLLIGGELLRGLRIPRLVVVAAAFVAGLALWGGISLMQREYDERWLPTTEYLRSTLAAVDVAGARTVPGYEIAFAPAPLIPARTYLGVAAEHGTPAFSEAELAARPAPDLAAADLAIAQALGLGLAAPRARTVACEPLDASPDGGTGTTLLHGGFTFENRSTAPVEVMLRRFASELSVSLGPLEAGNKAALEIPPDMSDRPWALGLEGDGPVELCTTR
ncbi:MAG: hypothetical protein AB7T48_14175 [Solirubrobacterales bacterium]